MQSYKLTYTRLRNLKQWFVSLARLSWSVHLLARIALTAIDWGKRAEQMLGRLAFKWVTNTGCRMFLCCKGLHATVKKEKRECRLNGHSVACKFVWFHLHSLREKANAFSFSLRRPDEQRSSSHRLAWFSTQVNEVLCKLSQHLDLDY